ncbi:hypothetical protein [Paenibacillus alba]|uniref:hypothetical protein n=1 Tax=Paenibacillus alba TaxID=1197127 RepID=UPI0015652ABD|nr:hypothetical protein [Paenibacillus alba]
MPIIRRLVLSSVKWGRQFESIFQIEKFGHSEQTEIAIHQGISCAWGTYNPSTKDRFFSGIAPRPT